MAVFLNIQYAPLAPTGWQRWGICQPHRRGYSSARASGCRKAAGWSSTSAKRRSAYSAGGKLYAYLNKCAHQGGPVCQGKIIPRVTEVIDAGGESHGFAFDEANLHIVCPWHGFEYDIKTGVHPGRPSARLIRVPVEEAADGIYVTV